jgi:hypothetical protein
MNSAEKLRNLLVAALQDPSQQGVTVASALVTSSGAPSLAVAIGHIVFLKKQIKSAIENNPKLKNPNAHLTWIAHVDSLLSVPTLNQPVIQIRSPFFGNPSVFDALAMCSEQIDEIEARDLNEIELKELQELASALHASIVAATGLEPPVRRTLLRIVRLLLDAIQNYRFEGAEGLRNGIEQFFGAVAMEQTLLAEFAKSKPEQQEAVKNVFVKAASCAEKLKPVAEAASALAEFVEKVSVFLLPKGG